MHLVQIPENRRDILKELYEQSCFTFEGLDISDKSALLKLEDLLRVQGGYDVEDPVWYWCKGKWFNDVFGLTDENAYKDDLTFVFIPDFYNPIFKLIVGARWLDDIIHNNAARQKAINKRKKKERCKV